MYVQSDEQYEVNGSGNKSKEFKGEIMSKLDLALNEIRSEKDCSEKRFHSSNHMENKIKEFENVLNEVKLVNANSQLKLSKIKDQARNFSQTAHDRHEIQYKSYKYQKPLIMIPSITSSSEENKKGNYLFHEYIKPKRKINYPKGCIEPDCRGICKCFER